MIIYQFIYYYFIFIIIKIYFLLIKISLNIIINQPNKELNTYHNDIVYPLQFNPSKKYPLFNGLKQFVSNFTPY